MYKRKQIAPERRTGKALLRDMDILTDIVIGKDKKGKSIIPKRSECQIMGNSCGLCPDCILYGYAATKDTGSQRARVLTDSGFVVRDIQQVMRNIKLNAIQDTIAGGIAGSAFASRENVLPQIFIPTVETLLDVTSTEFTYVLGNILKTTRYGAESNREGFIRNNVLGIYFSDVELFSNLELTQMYYDTIAGSAEGKLPDYLSADQFTDNWPQCRTNCTNSDSWRRRKVENLDGLLSGVRALYENEALVALDAPALDKEALRYEKEVKRKEEGSEKSGEDTEA